MTPLSKKQKRILFFWILLTLLLFACIFVIDFFQLTEWQPIGSSMVNVYGILSAASVVMFVIEHHDKPKQSSGKE